MVRGTQCYIYRRHATVLGNFVQACLKFCENFQFLNCVHFGSDSTDSTDAIWLKNWMTTNDQQLNFAPSYSLLTGPFGNIKRAHAPHRGNLFHFFLNLFHFFLQENIVQYWKRPHFVLFLFLGQKNQEKEPRKTVAFLGVGTHFLEPGLFRLKNKPSIDSLNSLYSLIIIFGGRTTIVQYSWFIICIK